MEGTEAAWGVVVGGVLPLGDAGEGCPRRGGETEGEGEIGRLLLTGDIEDERRGPEADRELDHRRVERVTEPGADEGVLERSRRALPGDRLAHLQQHLCDAIEPGHRRHDPIRDLRAHPDASYELRAMSFELRARSSKFTRGRDRWRTWLGRSSGN